MGILADVEKEWCVRLFSGSRKLDHFLLDKEVKQFEKCIADEQANDPFDFLTNPFEVNGYFFHA